MPLLIEMYPTQANPASGRTGDADAPLPSPFSRRGAPARVKSPLGSSVCVFVGKGRGGGEVDVPLDAL